MVSFLLTGALSFGSGTSFCRAEAPKAELLIPPYLSAITKSIP